MQIKTVITIIIAQCNLQGTSGRRCTCLEQSARSCHFLTTVAVFRSRLKTHLFNISYPFSLWL